MIGPLRHLAHESPRHRGDVLADLVCTPWPAPFCPVHGACVCWLGAGPSTLNVAVDPDCQLHSPLSSHGIEHEGVMS